VRVLTVAHRYPPDGLAGVERYTETIARRLASLGDLVSVVARNPSPAGLTLEKDSREGVVVYRIGGGELRLDNFLVQHGRLERLCMLALLDAVPDVVHVTHLIGLPPRFVLNALRLRIPVVVSLLDFFFACPLLHLQKRTGELCAGPDGGRECAETCFSDEGTAAARWQVRTAFFRGLLGAVDRVLCPSQTVAAYFREFAPEATIDVAPLGIGIDAEPVANHKGTAGALRLAYFGSVVPHKGVHTIIDAVRVAALECDVRLSIFGRVYDSAYGEQLTSAAKEVPRLDVNIHGEFSDEELPRRLAQTDFVVVPSQVPEVYPLVPREALAHGVPVLAGDLGGLGESVVDGENGLIFESLQPRGLAEKLRELWEDPDLVRRLKAGARQTAVPTAAEHVTYLREVYERVTRSSLRRSPARSTRIAVVEKQHEDLIANGFADAY
jgi:glycosyltransferase involved in cell wall biosynthesis